MGTVADKRIAYLDGLNDRVGSESMCDVREIGDGIKGVNFIVANAEFIDDVVLKAGEIGRKLIGLIEDTGGAIEMSGLTSDDLTQLKGTLELTKAGIRGMEAARQIAEGEDTGNAPIDLLTMMAIDFNMMMDTSSRGETYGMSSMQQIMSTDLFTADRLREYVAGTKVAAKIMHMDRTEVVQIASEHGSKAQKLGQEAIQQSIFMARSAVLQKKRMTPVTA